MINFEIIWFDGEIEIITGYDINDAFNKHCNIKHFHTLE